MTVSNDELAQRIRGIFADGDFEDLSEVAADKVEIVHVPPQPVDGELDGATWAAAEAGVASAIRTVIPNFTVKPAEVTTDGDQIRLVSFLTGTLEDGSQLNHRVDTAFTVKDGKVVKSVSQADTNSESFQLLMKALLPLGMSFG
jgi:ketosteroid isomerase-like protein